MSSTAVAKTKNVGAGDRGLFPNSPNRVPEGVSITRILAASSASTGSAPTTTQASKEIIRYFMV